MSAILIDQEPIRSLLWFTKLKNGCLFLNPARSISVQGFVLVYSGTGDYRLLPPYSHIADWAVERWHQNVRGRTTRRETPVADCIRSSQLAGRERGTWSRDDASSGPVLPREFQASLVASSWQIHSDRWAGWHIPVIKIPTTHPVEPALTPARSRVESADEPPRQQRWRLPPHETLLCGAVGNMTGTLMDNNRNSLVRARNLITFPGKARHAAIALAPQCGGDQEWRLHAGRSPRPYAAVLLLPVFVLTLQSVIYIPR